MRPTINAFLGKTKQGYSRNPEGCLEISHPCPCESNKITPLFSYACAKCFAGLGPVSTILHLQEIARKMHKLVLAQVAGDCKNKGMKKKSGSLYLQQWFNSVTNSVHNKHILCLCLLRLCVQLLEQRNRNSILGSSLSAHTKSLWT